MFGQYPSPVTSAAKWIFLGFFVIILMAFLLGSNFKDATWLNSDIAAAQADRIKIESAHQQATYELQERLATAQTEAEIREIQRKQALLDAQYQYDVQLLNQDLLHQDLAFRTRTIVLTILAGAFALMVFVSTIAWVVSRAIVYVRSVSLKEKSMTKFIPSIEKRVPSVAEREPYDPWNSPAYRRRKRIAAQEQERKEREEIAARMMDFRDPGRMSTEEYNKNPEAD